MRRVWSATVNTKPQGANMLKRITLAAIFAIVTSVTAIGSVTAHTGAKSAKVGGTSEAPQGFSCRPGGNC
jgi:hypothetical protein